MRRWILPIAGVAAMALTVGAGVGIMAAGDGGAACDRAALARSIADEMRQADLDGAMQFLPVVSPGCHEEDVLAVMQETTRGWHMMLGGVMMRSADHANAE